MKKLVPDPPHLLPYVTISPDLSPEEARIESDALMTCLHDLLDLYFGNNDEATRQILRRTSLYLTQLLHPLARHTAGAQP